MAATKSSGALNTWKDIAAYLGRGVRTVQRWERELRMPVHRPYGRSRTSVMALRSELDAWAAQHGIQERRAAAKSICNTVPPMPQRGKSMAQGPSGRSEWFERELIRDGDRWLIRCRCRKCGVVIVGSVTEGLTGDEEEHIEHCHTDRQSWAG